MQTPRELKKKGKEKKSLIPDNVDPNLLPGSLNKVSSYHQNSGLLCLNFMLLWPPLTYQFTNDLAF